MKPWLHRKISFSRDKFAVNYNPGPLPPMPRAEVPEPKATRKASSQDSVSGAQPSAESSQSELPKADFSQMPPHMRQVPSLRHAFAPYDPVPLQSPASRVDIYLHPATHPAFRSEVADLVVPEPMPQPYVRHDPAQTPAESSIDARIMASHLPQKPRDNPFERQQPAQAMPQPPRPLPGPGLPRNALRQAALMYACKVLMEIAEDPGDAGDEAEDIDLEQTSAFYFNGREFVWTANAQHMQLRRSESTARAPQTPSGVAK